MKKMFGVVLTLMVVYVLSQIIYGYFVGKHDVLYNIKIDNMYYNVKEIFTGRHKTSNFKDYDNNSYYYEISKDKDDSVLFSFKIIGNYSGVKQYLEDIKLFEDDNLICIYPIFKEHKNQLDVICNKDGIQYNYGVLRGTNNKLDDFVKSLKDEDYKHYSWNDNNITPSKYENIEIYKKNLINNQYIVVWNYNGFYGINSKNEKFYKLLKKDNYDNDLGILFNQHYIIPDYSEKKGFKKIIMTNLITSSSISIDLGYTLDYDSFIQGIVDNSIYIIDKVNKAQYEINISTKKCKLINGQNNVVMHYYNGKWEERSIFDVIDNNIKFSNEMSIPDKLNKSNAFNIDSVMGETDGYYYLYKKESGLIALYRVDKQNLDRQTLLFKVSSFSDPKYIKDSIYFINGDILYMYSDAYGLRPLIKYNEFSFNKNNMYDIFIDN